MRNYLDHLFGEICKNVHKRFEKGKEKKKGKTLSEETNLDTIEFSNALSVLLLLWQKMHCFGFKLNLEKMCHRRHLVDDLIVVFHLRKWTRNCFLSVPPVHIQVTAGFSLKQLTSHDQTSYWSKIWVTSN